MIKFTTINVDGVEVTREFETVEEIKRDWWSDDCTLPANDDKVIRAEVDGAKLDSLTTFEDLVHRLWWVKNDCQHMLTYKECNPDEFNRAMSEKDTDVKFISTEHLYILYTKFKNDALNLFSHGSSYAMSLGGKSQSRMKTYEAELIQRGVDIASGQMSKKEVETQMYSCSKGVVCTASPGQGIEDFAKELAELRKKGTGVLVGVFNDTALFIHSIDTEQDIIDQYFSKR